MQMAFFAIPARGDSGLQESLNAFLLGGGLAPVAQLGEEREIVGGEDFLVVHAGFAA